MPHLMDKVRVQSSLKLAFTALRLKQPGDTVLKYFHRSLLPWLRRWVVDSLEPLRAEQPLRVREVLRRTRFIPVGILIWQRLLF